MILTSPKLNARYEILRELGRGGMGIVYLARQKSLSREVAIKVIPPAAFNNPDTRARFAREIQVMSILNHENLVNIIECDKLEDESAYIVMEFLPGESLEDIRMQGPCDWLQVCRWGQQMAAGLAHAHAKGIIHRDIKPANVMLMPDHKIKVMDFGIAKAEGAQNLTMDRIVGTPVYMSPEQASGKPVDLRADIYSLGTLLYALLAGSAPFDDPKSNPMEVIMMQIGRTPGLLSSRTKNVPERFVELVHRMLSKVPDERPQDLNEVLEELKIIETKPESGFARTAADVLDSFRFMPRLIKGRAKASDFVLMEFLLPGLSFIGRKEFGMGFLLLALGVGAFFLPMYPLTTSLVLRLLCGLWVYGKAKGNDLKPSLEFLWHHRQFPIVFGVIVAFSGMFALFVHDTQAWEEEVAARTRRPEVAAAEKPTPTPGTEVAMATPTASNNATGTTKATPAADNGKATPGPAQTPRPDATKAAPTATVPPTPSPTATPRRTPLATPLATPAGDVDRIKNVLGSIVTPTPVVLKATPTPLPTAAPDSFVTNPQTMMVQGLRIMREDKWAEMDLLLDKLHSFGDAIDVKMLAHRLYLGYYMSQRDSALYQGGIRRGWKTWERDEDALRKALVNAPVPDAEYVLALTIEQPSVTSRGFTRSRSYSGSFKSPGSVELLRKALRSENFDRKIAALFSAKDVHEPSLGPDIALVFGFPTDNPTAWDMVRGSAISWFDAHGDAKSIPAIREAMKRPDMSPVDRQQIEALVRELERRP